MLSCWSSKFYKGNETTTENSFININIDKIFIKTNLNKLDKNNDEYLSKKENILMWNINNQGRENDTSPLFPCQSRQFPPITPFLYPNKWEPGYRVLDKF